MHGCHHGEHDVRLPPRTAATTEHGCHHAAAHDFCRGRRHVREWTRDEVDAIKGMYMAGEPFTAMARRIGVPEGARLNTCASAIFRLVNHLAKAGELTRRVMPRARDDAL